MYLGTYCCELGPLSAPFSSLCMFCISLHCLFVFFNILVSASILFSHSRELYSFYMISNFPLSLLLMVSSFNPRWFERMQRCYFNFIVSVEACVLTEYVVDFRESSRRFREVTFFCVWVKCATNSFFFP